MNVAIQTPDAGALKTRLRETWMAGDYDRFSRPMEQGARAFYRRLGVPAGARLLDVGCGSGQLALMAARDRVRVTGVDIAENLIERAQARANAERLEAHFEVADAEDLPYPDESFDFVVSLIGAMFAPRPGLVAHELTRVCAPGGTLAMANWTAEGFIGQMFRTIAKFIAPPGMPSPLLWGDEATVRERLGTRVTRLDLARREYTFNYPFPPAEVVEFFGLYYGPMHKAFTSLDPEQLGNLRGDLVALWSAHNRADGGMTLVNAEYLEVIATR